MSEDFSFLAYTGAWATIILGVWFLFEKAEETVSPEVRERASRWLLGLDPAEAVAAWTDAFASAFDRIFGERHLSWKCFRRSCLASLFSVAVVMLVWGALEPHEFRRVFDASAGFGVLLLALIFPVLTAGLNFLPDYLSLLETRWAIQRMRASGSPAAYLPLDLVATAMIAAMIVLPLFSLIPGTGVLDVLPALFSLFPEGTEAGFFGIVMADPAGDGGHHIRGHVPLAIWYYSAFFTSVWVWLFAAAAAAVRAAERLGPWLDRARGVLDVERKPFRSLGFAASVLVTVGFLIGLPFAAS